MTKAEEVKNKLRGMIDKVNGLTGESDTNLASAVDTLVGNLGALIVTDDGEGNVTAGIIGMGTIKFTDDGNGNVIMEVA